MVWYHASEKIRPSYGGQAYTATRFVLWLHMAIPHLYIYLCTPTLHAPAEEADAAAAAVAYTRAGYTAVFFVV